VQPALVVLTSATICRRFFLLVYLFRIGATCTVFFLGTSASCTTGTHQAGPGNQPGNAQAGQKFFQIIFVHNILLD
jgi:hypothetical protein